MISPLDYRLIDLAAVAFATGSAAVGLYIAYQAYRGLRRNESASMWYLSVGMVLLFGVTYTVALLGQSAMTLRILPIPFRGGFQLIVRILQFVGLLFIAYSMHLGSRS